MSFERVRPGRGPLRRRPRRRRPVPRRPVRRRLLQARLLRGGLHLRLPRIRPQRIRLAIAVILLSALILTGGWFLLRDSPLVSVDHVTVTGVEGADATAIRSALRSAASRMTTLDVQTTQLRAAVSRFPEVKALQVSTQLPHGLVIHVVEPLAVADVDVGGRKVPITGDGRVLTGRRATASLPTILLPDPLSGGRLTQPSALAAARLLAAAPYRLLLRLADVTTVSGHGLVGQLRDGPSIYFGDASRADAKWAALLAVLANSNSAGASYIDVTEPEHPAAGTTAALGAGGASGATGGAPASAATSGTAPAAAASGTAPAGAGTASAASGTAPAGAGTASPAASGTAPAGAGTASPAASGTPPAAPGTASAASPGG